jgi:hypothetical protein
MYAEDYAREVVYIDNAWLGNASTPSGGSQGGPCGPTSTQFGAEFWWYVLSDLSTYCLYRYYMTSPPTNTPSYTKSYASDSEDESGEEESNEEVQILIKPRTRLPAPVQLQQQQQQVSISPRLITLRPQHLMPHKLLHTTTNLRIIDRIVVAC